MRLVPPCCRAVVARQSASGIRVRVDSRSCTLKTPTWPSSLTANSYALEAIARLATRHKTPYCPSPTLWVTSTCTMASATSSLVSSAENPTVIEPSCAVALRVPSIVGPLGLSPTNIIHPTLTAKSSKKTSRPTGGAGASCTRIVYKAARTNRGVSVSKLSDLPVIMLEGERTTLGDLAGGRAALVVNVASRCGLTPQYARLEALHEELAERGFTVIGFPSNQFGGQEPGTSEEIAEFCSATYGVTFPMSDKVEVNGPGRDPIYGKLTEVADADGQAGDIQWNFEKFVLAPDGRVVARFRPRTEPDAPEVRAAIEAV